jgi:hypothetical protein
MGCNSISSSISRNLWMLSCNPLVIGKSCGAMTSRPFAFAVATARIIRSRVLRWTKSLQRLRSSLSISSLAAARKKRSNFAMFMTDIAGTLQ